MEGILIYLITALTRHHPFQMMLTRLDDTVVSRQITPEEKLSTLSSTMDFFTRPVMSVLLLLFLPLAAAQPWQVCQDSRGKYTSNSTYQANIQSLSSTLPAKAAAPSTGLFATRVAGNAPDTVYALAFCRGDITNASACAGCVASGFQDAQQLCPFNKAASLYYDLCLLRFADENFLATNNSDVVMLMNSQNFTASVGSVRLLLFTLLNATAESAASSSRRFTTSRLDVSSLPTLYCLMQCTPDLTAGECAACFEDFPRLTLQYLDGARGGRILATRCTMRYEIYPFYSGDTMLRIINLATTVPEMNTTAPTTPVTVYPQPAGPGGASAPPPPQPNPGIPEQAQRSPCQSCMNSEYSLLATRLQFWNTAHVLLSLIRSQE